MKLHLSDVEATVGRHCSGIQATLKRNVRDTDAAIKQELASRFGTQRRMADVTRAHQWWSKNVKENDFTRRNDSWISRNKGTFAHNTIRRRWKSIFIKMLQIHSMTSKSIPNHFATPPECSKPNFEFIQAFWTTFLKSTSWLPDATFVYDAHIPS